ncbi:MAG: hypothetical protein NTV63_03040 [Candidatus Woesearchaeota archaeon]|nr:hypothetical protein [Candidatus Woesearchaeota archaeon]
MAIDFFRGFIKGFKRVGENAAVFINSIILSVVYFLGIGLTAIFAKAFRKHFIKVKKPNSATYWEEREKVSGKIEDYFDQF